MAFTMPRVSQFRSWGCEQAGQWLVAASAAASSLRAEQSQCVLVLEPVLGPVQESVSLRLQ